MTVQAMLRRGMEPSKITAAAVAKEAKVSVAIIYRRADLFTLVQRANPSIQRRPTEQVYRRTVQRLQTELEKARADTEYYQKEAQLAKLAERRPGQEVMQLKKTILALQRQVADLERQLAHCTCGAPTSSGSPLIYGTITGEGIRPSCSRDERSLP